MKFYKVYQCLKKFENLSTEDIIITPIRFEDRILIRQWRNEQIYHLRQQGVLSEDEQDKYYKDKISPLFIKEQPSQLLFSIYRKGSLVGYGGLVHISWIDKNAEISFVMNSKLENEYFCKYWTIFLKLIEQVAFK